MTSWSLTGYHIAKRRRRRLYRISEKARNERPQPHEQSCFPFHRLPHEIIAEIFIFCLPDPQGTYRTSTNVAPLLLCNVCSSWRSFALTIPQLWSELHLKVVVPKADEDDAAALADVWISRSGALPLTLSLHAISSANRARVGATTTALLTTFFRYTSRWKSVCIQLIACPGVSFPTFGPTPLLRKFVYSSSWPVPGPFPFTSCPLLTTLTWPFTYIKSSNLDIPWHQLTHITMEHIMSTHQTLDILRSCPRLVELNVEIDDDFSPEQSRSHGSVVENRSLQNFSLVVYQACCTLLQSLSLPALSDFSLDTDYDSTRFISARNVQKEVLRFFARSKCKLEKLKLGDCGFTDAATLKCLRHPSCASLVELTITNVCNRPMFTDRVILALTDKDVLSENSDVLLPNLSHLSLEMCLSATSGLLGLMVLSRCLWWDKADRMQSLNLIARDLDDWDYTFLNIAKEYGLDVDIALEPYTDSEVMENVYEDDI